MDNRLFVPETEPFYREGNTINLVLSCHKKENHKEYRPIYELTSDQLPEGLKNEQVLHDLKLVAKRVVHLRVTKLSPSRSTGRPYSLFGTGFLTFDSTHGAVVNTSKHVVRDPFEAEHTIVTLFYDDNKDTLDINKADESMSGLDSQNFSKDWETSSSPINQSTSAHGVFMFKGSRDHFRSVYCSDYTAFLCKTLPVQKFFSKEEIEYSNAAFSWWNFSLKSLLLFQQTNIDVAIISHPHGEPKVITFGKMCRLRGSRIQPKLYTAPTCTGSSGAPVIRIYSESSYFISAGQYLHHGYWTENLKMGMGILRPPITFPYWQKCESPGILSEIISILYEPILYWTSLSCDFLHIGSTLYKTADIFAYTSSLSALFLTVDSSLFGILVRGYWLNMLLVAVLTAQWTNLRYALCYTTRMLISGSMFIVAWCFLLIMPRSIYSSILAIIVWLMILFLERYFSWSHQFMKKTIGSYYKQLRYRLTNTKKNK